MTTKDEPIRIALSDDEIRRAKPVCADFDSFRAGVRFMERQTNAEVAQLSALLRTTRSVLRKTSEQLGDKS